VLTTRWPTQSSDRRTPCAATCPPSSRRPAWTN
jgi:hypothetical protein